MRTLVVMLLLAACAAPASLTPPRYRAATGPVASAALFDVDRFAGRWFVVAHYPEPGACTVQTVSYAIGPDRDLSVTEFCAARLRGSGRVRLVGPGRFEVAMDPDLSSGSSWVLWVDEGYRTAVVADPDGRMARILDRNAQIPSDRLAAAKTVLDFNGFDLRQLQEAM